MLIKEFNKNKKCLICNKNFDNKTYSSFWQHIKKEHKITIEKYYLDKFLNGKPVYCACGCGKKTKFHKGKFFKYYEDHKNKMTPTTKTINQIKKSNEKHRQINTLLKNTGISIDVLKANYDDFFNLNKSMIQISNELNIDFRTLKSYWFKLGLISNLDIFKRKCKESKTKWFFEAVAPNSTVINKLNQLLPILKLEIADKKKITFDQIISFLGFNINKNYLSIYLRQNLTDEEVKKINFVKISQLELSFLNVLKFYFGNNVTHSFQLDHKIFDFKIGKKILIELDGKYWHSSEQSKLNDSLKNKIAKNNGFILIRVNEINVKKIEFINKIIKLYEKIK